MLFSNPGGFATQGAYDDSAFQQSQTLSFQNFALSQDELFNLRDFGQVRAHAMPSATCCFLSAEVQPMCEVQTLSPCPRADKALLKCGFTARRMSMCPLQTGWPLMHHRSVDRHTGCLLFHLVCSSAADGTPRLAAAASSSTDVVVTLIFCMCLQMQFDDGLDEGAAIHEPTQAPEWACA